MDKFLMFKLAVASLNVFGIENLMNEIKSLPSSCAIGHLLVYKINPTVYDQQVTALSHSFH